MELDVTVEGIRVGQAKYGQGVFATKSFSAEETIGQIQGYVICDPDYHSDYCIDLHGDHSLEPAAPYRFLNHSCSPNCQLVQFDVEDKGKTVGAEVWLETLHSIVTGEQLTIDYAWPASGAILCGCGSDKCRGWIVAEEERDRLPPVDATVTATSSDSVIGAV